MFLNTIKMPELIVIVIKCDVHKIVCHAYVVMLIENNKIKPPISLYLFKRV